MNAKGIGPQGLGSKGNNGFQIGNGSTKSINSPAKELYNEINTTREKDSTKTKPKVEFVEAKNITVKRLNNGEYRQNSPNSVSSHKMASYEEDGKNYAAPTLYPKDRKGTSSHDPKDWYESPPNSFAFADTAFARGERYGPFRTKKQAADFANNGYKVGKSLSNYPGEGKAPYKTKK